MASIIIGYTLHTYSSGSVVIVTASVVGLVVGTSGSKILYHSKHYYPLESATLDYLL